MAVQVGSWDCSYCTNTKIPGYIYDCPGCSHPRSKDVSFYLLPGAPIATVEQEKLMGNDPNWYCGSCDSGNKDENDRCWNCGSPRGSDSVQHEKRVFQPGQAPKSTSEAKAAKNYVSAQPTKQYVPTDDPYNPPIPVSIPASREIEDVPMANRYFSGMVGERKPWLKYGLIGSAVVAVLLAIFFLFIRTTERTATITDFSWSRNVAIEEYQTFHEGGWSIPVGGRQTGYETRQSGTEKVHDGYHNEDVSDTCYRSVHVSKTCTQDNGNGGFSSVDCSYDTTESYSCTKTIQVEDYHYIPVYDTWFFYDIERWTVISNHSTSGTDHEPYYDSVQPVGDKQRRVENAGTYTAYFECDGIKPFQRNYDLNTWLGFDYHQAHKIKVNALKIVLEVK